MEEKRQPAKTFRLGRVRANVWLNDAGNGAMYNVTVSRPYKDGDAWRDATSFSRADLLPLRKVLDQAHDWIWERELAVPTEEANAAA